MLSKTFRLPSVSHSESPRVVHTPLLKILIWPNGLETSRFSVVVAKRIDSRAVERNRLRRVIYTVIQNNLSRPTSGFDVRMILKKTTEKSSALSDEILSGLEKAGIAH